MAGPGSVFQGPLPIPNKALTTDANSVVAWRDGAAAANGLPPGGSTGQVATKQSGADYDVAWETPSGGGGGVYTEVATHADLPVTVGTPAVGTLIYVQESSGSYWTFNKKASGLWRRIADNGALADWDRAGDLEDVLPSTVGQATAEAGTDTNVLSWTAQRVKQAILALAPGVKLDDFAAPDDNTDRDATTSSHGLMPKADKVKLDAIEALADVTDAGNVGAAIHGASGKTTPVDADTVPLIDSAASNVLKKVTWANGKATLKTNFDTLYDAAGAAAAVTLTTLAGGSAPTGSGGVARATSAALTTPNLGTPSAGTLTNCTGLPASALTAGVLAANVTLGEDAGQIVLDAALSADGKWSGICEAGTAGATLAFGDLCYFAAADSRWELADASAAATAGDVKLGICVLAAASDGSATMMLLFGKIRADTAFPSMTISAPQYISETAGDITGTQPTTTDAVIRRIGSANTADELFFCPSPDYMTHT